VSIISLSFSFFLSRSFFSLFLFPQAGPDMKYLLGFIRTQLSTSTTIALVFFSKIRRILAGQGDKWDNRSKAQGISASFCTNGGGLMPDEGVDLYQENEELKVADAIFFVLTR
jgi:G protein-coupled receptor 158